MADVTWSKTRTPGVYVREGVRGKRYRVVYRDGTGRQITRNFPRLTDAETFKKSVGLNPPEDVAAGRITLRAVYDEMVSAHAAESEPYALATLSLHSECWKHLNGLAEREIRHIKTTDVARALEAISKPAMRDKTRGLVSTTFNFAVSKRYVTVNVVPRRNQSRTRAGRMQDRRTKGSDKRYLTSDELARLVDELPARYRAVVELMAYAGLRPGEAYALRVGKFDPMNRTLLIDTSTTGFTKTGEPRTLILPAIVAEMLVEHVARFSSPSDPAALIFPAEHGGMIQANNFRRRIFGPASVRADVNHGLTPNHCRHTAASFAIANGADVYAVAKMLGHSKPSITLDVYGELFDGSQENLAERLDGAIREARAIRPTDAKVVSLGM